MNDNLARAKEIISQAIQQDDLKEYDKAFPLYQRALEFFAIVVKHEKNPKTKEMLSQRVVGYVDRLEHLKKILDQTKKEEKVGEVDKLKGSLGSSFTYCFSISIRELFTFFLLMFKKM